MYHFKEMEARTKSALVGRKEDSPNFDETSLPRPDRGCAISRTLPDLDNSVVLLHQLFDRHF